MSNQGCAINVRPRKFWRMKVLQQFCTAGARHPIGSTIKLL